MPSSYEPQPAPGDWIDAVHYARTQIERFKGDLRTAITGICSRLQQDHYIGDAANDLWAWLEYDGEAPDPQFAAFMRLFQDIYDQIGYSVKGWTGWEPVSEGDQILVGSESLRVKGDFRYWFIETPEPIQHISSLRRLRYLKDTSGGCNFQFDAFRRMSLTYYALRGVTAENPDGINQLNSHFVNIAAETSRAHYHARRAVGGGKPQGEFYFVAEPAAHHLSAYGRSARLELWPDVESDNSDFHEGLSVPLRPGSVAYITPGTAHRGVDVFANVVVLPAYKLKNQYFVSPPAGIRG